MTAQPSWLERVFTSAGTASLKDELERLGIALATRNVTVSKLQLQLKHASERTERERLARENAQSIASGLEEALSGASSALREQREVVEQCNARVQRAEDELKRVRAEKAMLPSVRQQSELRRRLEAAEQGAQTLRDFNSRLLDEREELRSRLEHIQAESVRTSRRTSGLPAGAWPMLSEPVVASTPEASSAALELAPPIRSLDGTPPESSETADALPAHATASAQALLSEELRRCVAAAAGALDAALGTRAHLAAAMGFEEVAPELLASLGPSNSFEEARMKITAHVARLGLVPALDLRESAEGLDLTFQVHPDFRVQDGPVVARWLAVYLISCVNAVLGLDYRLQQLDTKASQYSATAVRKRVAAIASSFPITVSE